ncbi:hypothetical protein Rsub_02793 [Raphidocelis subcapitata]|uniref:C2 Aida-type domain-containing protein n=1 Tax=Raphidocelis subcapitata TaxID=307507 RepID=A0A2V0NZ45_9CHLO|nr:hypothetical protein Rsub_02793 [Raphidocelis subcapitata]|eukprot:GBF90085.1 hypothetical protein Rsub_02793 [Raphidocelis subcapitata]
MQALKPFVARLLVSDVSLPAPLLALVAPPDGAGLRAVSPGLALARWPSRRRAKAARDDEEEDSTPEAAGAAASSVQGRPLPRGASPLPQACGVCGRAPGAEAGTLRAAPEGIAAGDATLDVYIDAWNLKGAAQLVDASVVVSVRDAKGRLLEAVQETPAPLAVEAAALRWAATVHLQTPLSQLGSDWAVFFELRHWKAAKRKRSTKAWAMLEADEVGGGGNGYGSTWGATGTAGAAARLAGGGGAAACRGGSGGGGGRRALEVYVKPAMFAAPAGGRAPKLLTSRPLFLVVAVHAARR